VLFICGIAYYLLQADIARHHFMSEKMKLAMNRQSRKEIISQLCYFISIPAAFIHEWISAALFVAVALLWIIPDRNIEKALAE